MKKDTFYFQHDYSCTNDPKIQSLLNQYGATGYGLYWRLVEMLHEEQTNKINLKPYILNALESTLKIETNVIMQMINYMVETCELFFIDENYLWSKRVLQNLDKRKQIKEARSYAGRKSAEARKTQKEQEQEQNSTNVQQNVTKEIKGNEKKEKENIPFDAMLDFYNKLFNKNSRIFNQSNKSKFKARLNEGYTLQDIKKAMINAQNDNFHKQEGYKFCTLEYFSRSATLDKYSFNTPQTHKYIPTK